MAKDFWFTSDLHLNHRDMVEPKEEGRTYRDFANLDEMNDCLITLHNESVKPGDSVYNLGDVTFQPATSEHLVSKLQGKKRLCLGNHDKINSRTYLQNYFFEIGLWFIFNEGFICTHIPLRVKELRQGSLLSVHGHNHRGREESPQYMNLCVENWGYKPVHFDEILKRIRILKEIEEGKEYTWPADEIHPVLK